MLPCQEKVLPGKEVIVIFPTKKVLRQKEVLLALPLRYSVKGGRLWLYDLIISTTVDVEH